MSAAVLPSFTLRRQSLLRAVVPVTLSLGIAGYSLTRTDLHHAIITLLLFGVLLGVATIDLRTMLAPNALLYPGTLFALTVGWTLGRSAGWDALGGAFVAFTIMLVIAIAGRGRMGFGDVKMAALCGAVTGFRLAVPMLILTFVAGGFFAAGALASRRRRGTDVIAFTPFLALATVLLTLTANTYLTQ